jgi:type I restriction enzyme, S subunit
MMNSSNDRRVFYSFQIPSDWRLEKLGTFGETYTGLSGKTKDDFGAGKPYIPYLNIFNNAIISDGDFDFVNIGQDETQSLVQNGDLFFTTSSETPEEVGMCSVYLGNETELYLNSFCFGFRLNNEDYISTEFIAQLFRSSLGRRIIYKLAQGATRYNISKTNLLLEEIPLPPLPEQKAIAGVLSVADVAIYTTEKLLIQKELRKKWLMQQLLNGKKRLKGFSGEWKETRIGNLFKQIKNVNDGGDSHSIMTISSKLGLISQEDKFDRVIAGESLKKYTQLSQGDFAYNKGNSKTYPMGCIYRLEEKESALVPFVYICFSPTELVDGLFYNHWFLAHGLDRQLNKIITSGARGDGLLNVNTNDFFGLKIIYPPKEEQTAIAQVLQAADKEICLLKSKAKKLKEQKRGLMQVLLTGKIRLKTNL